MLRIDDWQANLNSDIRLGWKARQLGKILADHFRVDGKYQASFEHLCGEAGFINLGTVRAALGSLKQAGYVVAERVPGTSRRGMEYRPRRPSPSPSPIRHGDAA